MWWVEVAYRVDVVRKKYRTPGAGPPRTFSGLHQLIGLLLEVRVQAIQVSERLPGVLQASLRVLPFRDRREIFLEGRELPAHQVIDEQPILGVGELLGGLAAAESPREVVVGQELLDGLPGDA